MYGILLGGEENKLVEEERVLVEEKTLKEQGQPSVSEMLQGQELPSQKILLKNLGLISLKTMIMMVQ